MVLVHLEFRYVSLSASLPQIAFVVLFPLLLVLFLPPPVSFSLPLLATLLDIAAMMLQLKIAYYNFLPAASPVAFLLLQAAPALQETLTRKNPRVAEFVTFENSLVVLSLLLADLVQMYHTIDQ